jgi:signal peptidase I
MHGSACVIVVCFNGIFVAKFAYIVAFVLVGLVAIGAITTGPIVVLPFALIPLAAGIAILRKRVWGAYGLALYLAAQLLLALFLLYRTGSVAVILGQLVILVVLILAFFFAGRSLRSAGGEKGRVWPWIAVSVLTTVPILFVHAFVNPTGSMENTLLVGDHVLVQLFPKPRVARGDIIVFAYPIDHQQTFIKRVIAMPGDRIKIADKVVYLNGMILQEPYVIHKANYPDSYRDNLPSEPASTFVAAARLGKCRRKTSSTARSSCPRESTSSWATTGTIHSTAGIGDLSTSMIC